MKTIIEQADGLEALLGENVAIWCVNYIYAGKLVGVNDKCVKLTDAKIVYETGELKAKQWKDAQELPGDHYIQCTAIESFGVAKQ